MMSLAVGVWVLGAGSAAALTVDLSRPAIPRLTTLEDVARLHTDLPAPVRHLGIEPGVLTLQPITIVGRHEPLPLLTPPPRTTIEQMPDIARMRCAGWRDLEMGSGRVQVCE